MTRRMAALIIIVLAPWARAAEEPLELHGYADVFYDFNFNRPSNGDNFSPGTGTTAKRANELGLNLAAFDVLLAPKPVGFHLILNVGSATEVVHSGEPRGTGIGPEVWRFVQRATVAYRAPLGAGLLIEAGIMPCHAGLEVFQSKDNWNYTRSWMAEFSPYYQAGISLSYPLSDHWSAQVHVLNGWQIIGENNDAKTVGTQLAWSSDRVTFSWNTLAGPELPRDNEYWRFFNDLVLVFRATGWLHLAATADVGHQQLPAGASATWVGGAGYVRFIARPWLALSLRGEYFSDPAGGISGAAQRVAEGTATLELKPHQNIILKLEGRYDRSTAPVFVAHELTADGSHTHLRDQALLIFGAVASL